MRFKPSVLIIAIGLSILVALSAQAWQLYTAPESPKIGIPNSEMPSDEVRPIWVFFTDKGIFAQDAYQDAIAVPERLIGERAIQRRAKVRSEDNLVDFRDLPVVSEYVSAVLEIAPEKRVVTKWFNGVSVDATPEQIRQIATLDFVRKIQPVARGKKSPMPKSDAVPEAMERSGRSLDYGESFVQNDIINVPATHDVGLSGEGVLVCMLDSGFRHDEHESLIPVDVLTEWDFVENDGDTDGDDYVISHGTSVLSICAGFMEGQLIGPGYGAQFILGRTEDSQDEYPEEEDYWQAGVEWADSLGADLITSSLAYIDWYEYEDLNGDICVTTIAADWAAANGILVCNAMANAGPAPGTLHAPADADSIIACGSVNSMGYISSFSSRGPTYDGRIKPEVCAMGEGNYHAVIGSEDGYSTGSGTSYSTPMISGAAALVMQNHPDWTPMQVREALMMTASQPGDPDNDYGWGIIDALSAAFYKSIGGKVVDVMTGDPLANVTITYSGTDSGTVYTDENGRYLISDLEEGTYTLTATVEGYQAKTHVYTVPPWLAYADFQLIPEGMVTPLIFLDELILDDDNQGDSSGDGDGIADVNEMVELNLILYNEGNLASDNTTVEVVSASPYLDFSISETTIGSINPGDTVLVYAALFEVLPDVPHNEEAELYFMIEGDDYETIIQQNITLTANMPHWPRSYDGLVSSPKMIDLDDDEDLEILFGGSVGDFHILHHDGSEFGAWPLSVGGDSIYLFSNPAIVDMDDDGENEVLVSSSIGVHCWNLDGTDVPGWPQEMELHENTVALLYPMVEDLDNDGVKEVVMPTFEGEIYVWNSAGELQTTLTANDTLYCSPAVGDLDGDNDLEIVVGAGAPNNPTGYVHAWHHDGSVVDGEWPLSFDGTLLGGITIADMDEDGNDDVLAPVTYLMGYPNGKLYLLSGDGTNFPNWPKVLGPLVIAQAAVGDVDLDANLEIVIPAYESNFVTGQLYVLDVDGNTATGWPQSMDGLPDFVSPTIGDINGDYYPELLVSTLEGKFYAFDYAGELMTGYPYQIQGMFSLTGIAALGDMDSDGDVDAIISTIEGDIYAWDMPGDYNSGTLFWGMACHDYKNTSNYETFLDTSVSEEHDIAVPDRYHLSQNYPNPFNPITTISFQLPKKEKVSLKIYDVTGRLIKTLIDGKKEAGKYRVIWHGDDEAGKSVSSGVYFYKMETTDYNQVKRCVLLR